MFQQLRSANPGDPLYDHYLERIERFRVAPPPGDWRGEFRFTVD